jgi:hypothetical protein
MHIDFLSCGIAFPELACGEARGRCSQREALRVGNLNRILFGKPH